MEWSGGAVTVCGVEWRGGVVPRLDLVVPNRASISGPRALRAFAWGPGEQNIVAGGREGPLSLLASPFAFSFRK